jgi:hypothetical protein
MRREMGHHPLSPGVIGDLQTQFQELLSLDKEVVACVEEAVRLKHPLLLAESLLAKAMIFLVRTVNTRLVLSKPGEQLPPVSHQTTDQMIMELQQAEGYFRQAEHTEGVVRTVLLQADWLEAMGSSQEAVKVAVSVEGIAIAMGYTDQIRRIEDHRSGITEYRRITDRITSAEQPDNMIALASDAELHRFAHDCLQSLELPLDRLPVIERECESMRCIAVEQRTWCRHLELFQDLRHTQSPRTHYLRDPDRSCYCKFRKIHGLLQTPDWSAVIAAFKRNYCADCSDRSPETASSPT